MILDQPPCPDVPPFPQRLEFSTNSVRNTTLATPDDSIYFEIVTRFWHPSITKINKLNPGTRQLNTVAEIERVGLRGGKHGTRHRVRFLKGEEHKTTEFGEWMSAEEFVQLGRGNS